jgi:hypothetical protein
MLRPAVALQAALAVSLTVPTAAAFERQWHVGGGAGIAAFADRGATPGPALSLHGAYGLSDTFDVRVAALGSTHQFEDHSFSVAAATAGLAYKLDVLSWVPYVGLQVGYYRLGSERHPGPVTPDQLGLSVDLGIDYAVRRHFGLGLELRYHGFLSDPMSSLADAPLFTGLLRAEYRWGW